MVFIPVQDAGNALIRVITRVACPSARTRSRCLVSAVRSVHYYTCILYYNNMVFIFAAGLP